MNNRTRQELISSLGPWVDDLRCELVLAGLPVWVSGTGSSPGRYHAAPGYRCNLLRRPDLAIEMTVDAARALDLWPCPACRFSRYTRLALRSAGLDPDRQSLLMR